MRTLISSFDWCDATNLCHPCTTVLNYHFMTCWFLFANLSLFPLRFECSLYAKSLLMKAYARYCFFLLLHLTSFLFCHLCIQVLASWFSVNLIYTTLWNKSYMCALITFYLSNVKGCFLSQGQWFFLPWIRIRLFCI